MVIFSDFEFFLGLHNLIKTLNNLIYIGGFYYVYQLNDFLNQFFIFFNVQINSRHTPQMDILKKLDHYTPKLSLSSFFISAEPAWKNFSPSFKKFKWDYVLILLPTILATIWGISIIFFFFVSSTRKRLTVLLLLFWATIFIFFIDYFLFYTSNRRHQYVYGSVNNLKITLNQIDDKGLLALDTFKTWSKPRINSNGITYLLNTWYTKTKHDYLLKYYFTFSNYKLNSMPEYKLNANYINTFLEKTRTYTGLPFYWIFTPTTIYENLLYWNTIHLGGFVSNIDQQLINIKSEHFVRSCYKVRIDNKLHLLNCLDDSHTNFIKLKNKYSCNYKKVTTQIRKVSFKEHIIQIHIFPQFYYLSAIEKLSRANQLNIKFAINRTFGQHFHLTNPALLPMFLIASVGSIFVLLFSNPNNLFNSTVNHTLSLFTKKSIKNHLKQREHGNEFLIDWQFYETGGIGYMELLSLDPVSTKKHTMYHYLKIIVNDKKPKVFKVGFLFVSLLLVLQTCVTNSSFTAVLSFTILVFTHLWYHKFYLKWTLETVEQKIKKTFFDKNNLQNFKIYLYVSFGVWFILWVASYDICYYFLVVVLFVWVWSYVGFYNFYNQKWQVWATQRSLINLMLITALLLFFTYFEEGRSILYPPILPLIICFYFFCILRLWKAFYLLKSYGAYSSYFLIIQPLLFILFIQIWSKEIGNKSLCILPFLLIYESIKTILADQTNFTIKYPLWKSSSVKARFFFFFLYYK